MKDDSSPYQTVRFAPVGVHYGLAHAALLKGRHSLAQRLIQPLLRLGDASAQWYLGLMHHTGTGAMKDVSEARRWYTMSAAQGFRMGEDGLLILDATEKNASVDPHQLRLPSSLDIYRNPSHLRCSERDTEIVFCEFQREADLGNVEIQILLGNCYEFGIFVPAQWEFALEWYRRAGAQGSGIGVALHNTLSLSKLDDEGYQERCELAFVCELAATSLLKGTEPANAVDAFSWCYEAAQRDDMYACWRVSEFYLMGYGVDQNLDQSSDYGGFVIENAEKSEAYDDYISLLAETSPSELIRKDVLLKKRRQLKTAMARPISSQSCISRDSPSPNAGSIFNDNPSVPNGPIPGAC